MFYPTTCVGLRYGSLHDMLSGFSREPDYHRCPLARGRTVLSRLGSEGGFACPPLRLPRFNALFRQCADVSLLRLHIAHAESNRFFTVCPSNSPYGFSLGPDLP